MNSNITSLWDQAADFDPTLKLRKSDLPALEKKRVVAGNYSRSKLFSRMMMGQISLFRNFSVPLKGDAGNDRCKYLATSIRSGFTPSQRARVQLGRERIFRRVKIPELMKRWEDENTIVSVTDLHFRKTRFEKVMDTSRLSNFNVLCNDPELIDRIEMMTLVVSSKGNVTDSHADDCDGSNHCFLGKKLWLAWDRIEGRSKGFQDADRDKYIIDDQAAFDMKTFISLPSARWFVVKENETLFLPGSLAHKVITLEHYIGVGSFHVALPSYVRTLKRWIVYDTVDVGPRRLLNRINRAVLQSISKLKGASQRVREDWGLNYMRKANELWRRNETPETKTLLLNNPTFAAFIEAASKV